MTAGESLERDMLSKIAAAEVHEAKARYLRERAAREAVGLAGERAVAAVLDPLRSSGYRVLHDRRVPRSPANIDHLLVGPLGVVVIDAKNYAGKLRLCDDGQVLVGGRPHGREVDAVVGYAKAVEHSTRPKQPNVPVMPVVCFSQDVGLALPVPARGAMLLQLDQLLPWLMNGFPRLTPRQVWDLSEHLEMAHPSRVIHPSRDTTPPNLRRPAAPPVRRAAPARSRTPPVQRRVRSPAPGRPPRRSVSSLPFPLQLLLIALMLVVALQGVQAAIGQVHLPTAPPVRTTPVGTAPLSVSR
ncbi:MAG TPA: nuclease-related domain-containing protein [Mycobacteriales bacterium]|nr:nuclease-related domain-containing protein [Mycobacteriales bacterium]